MRKLIAIGCLGLATSLAACKQEPARFDASSEAAFKASAQAVRDSMPETQRPALQAALMQVVMHAAVGDSKSPLLAMAAMSKNPEGFVPQIAPFVNGRTGPELIAVADDLKRQRETRQLAALDGEISALETELQEAKAIQQTDRAILDRIKIEGARYYWSKGSYSAEPVIAFKITNKADRALAKVHFGGLLETPGRSVPWVKDGFYYEIKGGLEPGESQSLNLVPGRFGAWAADELKNRNDLVLTLTLEGIEDASGTKIGVGSDDKIRRTEERLGELRKKRSELAAQQS